MKLPKIHIIHGIHKSEGDISTPALLIPELEAQGFEVEVHDYGYVYALTTRWENPKRAAEIAPKIKPGDYILAHSNGCDITRIMIDQEGIAPAGIILLQPALDVDTVFSEGDYFINVFFNEDDRAVFMAKWFLWFHHPYGAMGRYGYEGNDRRICNYDTLHYCPRGGHSKPYLISSKLRMEVVDSIHNRQEID